MAYDAMLRRARGTIFWPGMTNDIKTMVENCNACQQYNTRQQSESLISGEIPLTPWDIIHQDLMDWAGRVYLVTVDGFSDFIDVQELRGDTTSAAIIAATKRLCAIFGRPRQLHTDSDPRYRSATFQQFCSEWRIQHVLSSPHHHSANGKAESAVKIAKKIIKKSNAEGADLQMALLEWRSCPQKEGLSPAQKFLCRCVRTFLPAREQDLQPKIPRGVKEAIKRRREEQKRRHDQRAKDLVKLKTGDRVRIQPVGYETRWSAGVVRESCNPRTYRVRRDDGRILMRNRIFLRKCPNIGTYSLSAAAPGGPPRQPVPGTVSPPQATAEEWTTPPSSPVRPTTTIPHTTRSGRVVNPPARYASE